MSRKYSHAHFHNIHINHAGFLNNASKTFVYTGEGAESFTVQMILDGALTEVYTGKLHLMEETEDFDKVYIGDFSPVTQDGVYIIQCGKDKSRSFAICKEIYNPAMRLLTNYFVWQRCCDDKGWNGKCHTEEKLIDKNGKLHRFCGGHHQSGDLRKWTYGCPQGVEGLCNFLMLGSPLWNDGEIEYDIAHSLKYYLSLISDEGYVFDCTFVPEDYDKEKCEGKGFGDYYAFWKPYKYFDMPVSPNGHWDVICLLSAGSKALAQKDSILSKQAREGALKIWQFMINGGEKINDYDWEIYPPIGHFEFKRNLFEFFFEDSAWMLCGKIMAGVNLYTITKDEDIKAQVISALDKLYGYMRLSEDGSLDHFILHPDEERIAEEISYFHLNIPLAFIKAVEVFEDCPRRNKWIEVAEAAVKKYEKMSKSNCYGKTTNRCNRKDGKILWDYLAPSYNDDHAVTAIFLAKSAPYCGKKRCLSIAQRLLDWLFGTNPYDASNIEGVGHNHINQAVFGEFIPSIPRIPGGVFTDITPDMFDGIYGSEYDMPIVGHVLYALKLYTDAMCEE